MTMSGTMSDNQWYNEWRQATTNDNQWSFWLIFSNERGTSKHPEENFLNLEEDLEERSLNYEQKQAPKKEYWQ